MAPRPSRPTDATPTETTPVENTPAEASPPTVEVVEAATPTVDPYAAFIAILPGIVSIGAVTRVPPKPREVPEGLTSLLKTADANLAARQSVKIPVNSADGTTVKRLIEDIRYLIATHDYKLSVALVKTDAESVVQIKRVRPRKVSTGATP